MDAPIRTELGLIGAVYDAVIDPELWDDTLDRIRRHFGFHIAAIAIDAPGGHTFSATSNIPAPYLALMHQHAAAALDLWKPDVPKWPIAEPIVLTDHLDDEAFARNPYFEFAMRPQGIVDQVVIALEHSDSMTATLALGMHETMGPLTDWQIEGLRSLAPHLRRAASISGLLNQRTQTAEALEAALSALGSAVILVGEDRRIVYANERAVEMLKQNDPLLGFGGQLDISGELVRGQLRAALATAGHEDNRSSTAHAIPVRRRDGSELVVHVMPLEHRLPATDPNAVAAIYVAEPGVDIRLPMEALQMLYEFRPAECRVFELIVRGLSSCSIAEALGIAPSTVKTHTLRIYDKIGVHSRAELMRIARDMSLGMN